MKPNLLKVGVTALAAALVLTACGDRGSSTDSGSSDSGGSSDKTVTLGVIAPLTGDLSALGKGIQHSAELAVKQANDSGELGDWKIKVEALDDEAKTDPGRAAASKLASNDKVIGVVGPLNSSVGQVVAPVLNDAKITVVSPANTNPALTRGADYATAPKRAYETYFRTCTTDDVQGPFAADYLYNTAGVKKVATIHDKKAYGQGLVEAFAKAYKELGGEIVAEETINADDSNFSAVVSTVKAKSPDVVYYGGEYPQAGPLSKQMKAGGLNVPLMGGDGIYSSKFIELASASSDKDLSTSVGAPVEDLPSAKKFVEDYKAAGFADPYEAYGAYSYDAAQAIIKAFKAAKPNDLKDAKAVREGVLKNMASVSFDGVTGKVAFNEYGDNTARVLTVYKVDGGKWKAESTKDFS